MTGHGVLTFGLISLIIGVVGHDMAKVNGVVSSKASERLNPKLEAVLCRLCEQLGMLTMTHAVKLPYLVDVVASHVLGQPFTGGEHQTWTLGVVTSDAWRYFREGGDDADPFVIKASNQYPGGRRIYACGKPDYELTPEETAVVDSVADSWGRYGAKALGVLTKALNTQLSPDVWGKNLPGTLGEDAFARLSDGWQAFYQRLPSLDFSDRRHWGEPIKDAAAYLDRALGG